MIFFIATTELSHSFLEPFFKLVPKCIISRVFIYVRIQREYTTGRNLTRSPLHLTLSPPSHRLN